MTYQEFEREHWPALQKELVDLEPLREQERRADSFAGFILLPILLFWLSLVAIELLYPDQDFYNYKDWHGFIVVPLLIIAFLVRDKIRPRNYRKLYKEKVIAKLMGHAKYEWQHLTSALDILGERENLKKHFFDSGLYTSKTPSVEKVGFDDIFKSSNKKIFMCEAAAWTSKNNKLEIFFGGLFLGIKLNKKFVGETYLKSEDREPFITRLGSIQLKNNPKEANLEWNDFEKSISVQTTNEIEAREILTPDFMEVLYEWWHSHKKAVRIAFKNDHIYLSFPSSGIHFEPNKEQTPEMHKKQLWETLDSILLVERLFGHIEHKYRQ